MINLQLLTKFAGALASQCHVVVVLVTRLAESFPRPGVAVFLLILTFCCCFTLLTSLTIHAFDKTMKSTLIWGKKYGRWVSAKNLASYV